MITPLYAAFLAFLFIGLSVVVIKQRRAGGVGIGHGNADGDDFTLIRRMRAQANFAEYTPFFLLLLFLAEGGGLAAYLVHGLGALFTLGRISHAFSLLKAERYEHGRLVNKPTWRVAGMVATFTAIAFAAVCIVALHFSPPIEY